MSNIDEFMQNRMLQLEYLDKILKTISEELCQKRSKSLPLEEEEEEGEENDKVKQGYKLFFAGCSDAVCRLLVENEPRNRVKNLNFDAGRQAVVQEIEREVEEGNVFWIGELRFAPRRGKTVNVTVEEVG